MAMKWLGIMFGVAICTVLLVLGFAQYNPLPKKPLPDSTARPASAQGSLVAAVPANLPDIEHIPIYPNAVVLEALNESETSRRLRYEVSDSIEKVDAFYKGSLADRGWVRVKDVEQNSYPYFYTYTWSNQSDPTPWHLKLDVALEDGQSGGTRAILIYGRFPQIGDSLPTYPGAQQIVIEYREEAGKLWHVSPVRVTTMSYLSDAAVQDIEEYYNSNMHEYGWMFFEVGGRGPVNFQTGSITSKDGLFFLGRRPGSTDETSVAVNLHITARPEQNGGIRVQLEVREEEMKTDF
jgi:hypothetical protein